LHLKGWLRFAIAKTKCFFCFSERPFALLAFQNNLLVLNFGGFFSPICSPDLKAIRSRATTR
jgi:hypothetical protein